MKAGIYTENGSAILNLATEHTQLTTYPEIGKRGEEEEGGQGVMKGQGEGGGGRYSKGTPKWVCFSVWGECSQALKFAYQLIYNSVFV